MLVSEQTNSSSVKKNSTFMETVQDKLKDIENFSNWSAKEQMIAVGAIGVMVGALLPFVAAALPVAATGAIVAFTLFFAVKAIEYAFKGLKWSAEKTVDGVKYTTGKIRDSAVHAKDSVKGAVSYVGQATREGIGSTLKTMGDKMRNLGRSMSDLESIPGSIESQDQTVILKTEEKTKNFNSVKEMFIKNFFEDKTVNSSALTQEIFSELKRKLDKACSVDSQQGFKKDQLINHLGQQVDFVSKLNDKKLQKLLAQDDNNLYEIFSEHHSEIKKIIEGCKTELTIGSLSRGSSMDSLNTNSSTISSEAELLNSAKHKKVKQSSSFFSRFHGDEPLKEATDIKYQAFSEPDTSSRQVGESTFYVALPKLPRSNSLNSIGTVSTATVSSSGSKDFATVSPNRLSRSSSFGGYGFPKLTPVDPPKVPGRTSPDSGRSSPGSSAHSMPTRQGLSSKEQFDKELGEKLAKRCVVLNGVSLEHITQKVTKV